MTPTFYALLAQATPSGKFLQDNLLLVSILVGIGAGLATIGIFWITLKKHKEPAKPTKLSQPVGISINRRFNYDVQQMHFTNTDNRLKNHEERIEELEKTAGGFRAEILADGDRRTQIVQTQITALQQQINDMGNKIIATIANAKKIHD
jgi:hypothetical protein